MKTTALLLLALLTFVGCTKKPDGPDYSQAQAVTIALSEKPVEKGVYLTHTKEDGPTQFKIINGQTCAIVQPQSGSDAHISFKLAPSFKKALGMDLKVTVEYYDVERSSFWIEYDGWDTHDDKAGAYTRSKETIKLTGNPTKWLTAELTLPKARLRNRQEGDSDFRICVDRAQMMIHAVKVEKAVPTE